MKKVRVNKISSDTVWEMLWKGWALAKVNYSLSLLTVLFVMVVMTFLSVIPGLGELAAAIFRCVIPIIYLVLCQKWEKGEPGSFDDVIQIFKDKETFLHLFPMFGLSFAVAILVTFFDNALPPASAVIFGLFIASPMAVIIPIAITVMYFNRELDWIEALRVSTKGLWVNAIPFAVEMVLVMVLFVLSTLALVLPLFLIALPTLMTLQYLWYRLVHEDLVLESNDEPII